MKGKTLPPAPPPVPISKPIGLQILSTMSLLHTAHAGDNWSDNPISIELKTPRLSIVPRTLSGIDGVWLLLRYQLKIRLSYILRTRL